MNANVKVEMYQRTRSVIVRQSVAPFCGATTLNFFPPGGLGVSPSKLPAFEALGPPRPRGAAGGKIKQISGCSLFHL